MAVIATALPQLLGKRAQGGYPFARAGPLTGSLALWGEGALEQRCDWLRNRAEGQGSRRTLHLPSPRARAIGESELLDRLLQRHFAWSQIMAGKRVAPHEEKLKDQHGEAEGIMIWRTQN